MACLLERGRAVLKRVVSHYTTLDGLPGGKRHTIPEVALGFLLHWRIHILSSVFDLHRTVA